MYQKSTLNNGIRVVTESVPSVRSVSIGVMVDTGLRDECPHKAGHAHMIEHLMFQGTDSRDAMQIARLMDEAGGCVGGFTARDYTCYSATVLDDYRTYVLDLFGDILLNSNFRTQNIEIEKQSILREIDAFNDLPDQRADTLLKAQAWNGHPFGKPITGAPESVRSLTRDDVVDFYQSHYLPNRMIIAAAGNLDHQDIVAQAEDAFWPLSGQTQPTQNLPLDPHFGVAVEFMPVTQVYFSIGIPTDPYIHPDRYGLHIINKILGDGISSRLFRRIREDQGMVYDIHSEYHAYRDGGLLIIEGSTNPDLFQQVINQILSVLSRLITGFDPVQPEELVRAKNQIKAQHIIAAEDVNTLMGRLSTQEFYFGRNISTTEIVEQIDAIDFECLEKIIHRGLAKNLCNMSVAVVGPAIMEPYDLMVNEAIQDNLYEQVQKGDMS